MRPSNTISYKCLKNLIKRKSIHQLMMLRNTDKLNLIISNHYLRRNFNTSSSPPNTTFEKTLNHQINESKSTTSTATATTSTTNTIGYYGHAILNFIQEPNNVTQKFFKEFTKYYSYLNEAYNSSQINENINKNISTSVKPISLKDTKKSQNLVITQNKTPLITTNNVQSEFNLEEKILNLCDSITKASSILIKSSLISDLFKLLYESPDDVRDIIYRKRRGTIFNLLNLRENAYKKDDKLLYGNINQCLAILGYVDPSSVKHHGINILSLDGGGAKGFVTIEVLKNIEKLCGKQIHEIFDYICGTSTGAVLAALLGVYKLSLEEIERQYKIFIKEIFSRNRAAGLGNLVMSYAYYDTKIWESMLKEAMGDTLVINSAKDKDSIKISMVSNVTTPNQMKIFLFRNYSLPPWAQSHYDGTCRHKVWEAVRASSAAPGYYEDFKLDGYVFHDGGLLANNPTAIALHEVKHLWPSVENNCIVSIGNGRYKPAGYFSTKADSISLKQKINRIVGGISCTETVHNMLLDLLPTKMYFRFNPHLSEEFHLDENRPTKWRLMQYETNMYMRRNKYKFEMAAKQLLKPKSSMQHLTEFLKEKYLSPV